MRGFTLIEILVVMLVIAIGLGLASAIARPDDQALVELEARRLAQLMSLAATEARVSGHALSWTTDGSRYRFMKHDGNAWMDVLDTHVLRARELPTGMTVSRVTVNGAAGAPATAVVFDARGALGSYSVELGMASARAAVMALPNGRVDVVRAPTFNAQP